jgi:asparagine synthase (glutamine-hydrolysing)
MCGIAGIISTNKNTISSNLLKQMTDVIAHRGPDGDGHYISENGQVGLGHRRLSIIDLSHGADQPMHYLGRYSIVFNGEIYNYIELKETLQKKGYSFKTQSDTEVLMAMFDCYKEDCLAQLDGMFSFVIYDKNTNEIFCARDRFGEKPFFYSYKQGEYFYFGSEMKCLWAGGVPKETNHRMMFNYLSYAYLENQDDLSETFFENCSRLPHGHFIKLNVQDLKITIKKYYELEHTNINTNITYDQACAKLSELMYTSVSRRLRSDVTVGSSLSGGLDSSLVVCIIDELKGKNQKQNTFSAVFPGFKKDERKFIDYVTAQTNVEPHFVTPDDNGLMQDIKKLSWHQEEPFGSASIYAQYAVMQLAKQNNVTVLLDGQGADEILAGYHFYYQAYFKELKNTNPTLYKQQYAAYLKLHSNNPINAIYKTSITDTIRSINPKIIKPLKQVRNRINQFKNPLFNKDFFSANTSDIFETKGNNFNTLNEALHQSTIQFGLQQLLRYADRNSMAHSREVRLPFLYHELVEFLFTLPATFKINNGWTKVIMRNTFDNLMPKEIAWRTDKIGYEPPQKKWMENADMIDQVHTSVNALINQGYLSKHALSVIDKPKNASDGIDYMWQFFMAGLILPQS